jgi:hypothetical protein
MKEIEDKGIRSFKVIENKAEDAFLFLAKATEGFVAGEILLSGGVVSGIGSAVVAEGATDKKFLFAYA